MLLLLTISPDVLDNIKLFVYFGLLIFTIIKILLDTSSTPKTLAYLLLVTLLPVFGMLFYYAFGNNYRHKNTNKKTADELASLTKSYKDFVPDHTKNLIQENPETLQKYTDLIQLIHSIGDEKLSVNKYRLLLDGEQKFPEVLKTLEKAEHHIHMEYYAWENDVRGNQIKDVLINKTKSGVKVRVMYDDYASRGIIRNIVKELKEAGVEIYPVLKIKLRAMANRMNHRDHRKIIIMDGHTGFIGGINISDRYDNSIDTNLWWRDTHLKIEGETVHNLQRHFMVSWNSCQPNKLEIGTEFFPNIAPGTDDEEKQFAQLVAGGPIYRLSNIMLTYFKIFTIAKKRLWVTNPYFIPNDSILDALKQAAISGVDVRLMMPDKSDSVIVGAASRFYYQKLLQAGVKIFLYKKGFIHAKTVVVDDSLSVVGTANMDIRSFDLNYEIMSVIYGKGMATELGNTFLEDLKDCVELDYLSWIQQGTYKKLGYATSRLASSFL